MQNSIGHIKYVLLIERDVTRGKHHVMKSSRPLSVRRVKGRNTLITRREGEGLESRLSIRAFTHQLSKSPWVVSERLLADEQISCVVSVWQPGEKLLQQPRMAWRHLSLI